MVSKIDSKTLVGILVTLIVGIVLGYAIFSFENVKLSNENHYLQMHNSFLKTENSELWIENNEIKNMVNYEVWTVVGQQYYNQIIEDFRNAKESIFVAMYSMIYQVYDTGDWGNDLINELVFAKQRGIDVKVLIEYQAYFDTMNNNRDAFDYLRANNVDVTLDHDSTTTDHMKLVIVDDEIVYVGSHNWSESALYHNTETSVKIVSKQIASSLKQYIYDMTGF